MSSLLFEYSLLHFGSTISINKLGFFRNVTNRSVNFKSLTKIETTYNIHTHIDFISQLNISVYNERKFTSKARHIAFRALKITNFRSISWNSLRDLKCYNKVSIEKNNRFSFQTVYKLSERVWNNYTLSSDSLWEKDHVWNQSWIRAASETDDFTHDSILCTHTADEHGPDPGYCGSNQKVNILLSTLEKRLA